VQQNLHSGWLVAAAAAANISVGWERELFTADTFIADAELPPAMHPINKAHAVVMMSLLDCFSVVLYFAVTLLIIWKARKLAYDADMHTVSMAVAVPLLVHLHTCQFVILRSR
jgi:hypothetical protein